MGKTIEKLTKKVADARSSAALGAEFAPDHVEVRGVKFYYQTVAHAWVIPMAAQRCEKLSTFEKGIVTTYLLAQSPEDVRNRCMQEIRKGEVFDRAMDFFISRGITPADLADELDVEELLRHPYEKNA